MEHPPYKQAAGPHSVIQLTSFLKTDADTCLSLPNDLISFQDFCNELNQAPTNPCPPRTSEKEEIGSLQVSLVKDPEMRASWI
jgi:hypothetical protein